MPGSAKAADQRARVDELAPSSVFAKRYRINRRIGTGGFGSVYEAVHSVTGRRCALKVLWPHFASEESFRRRFLQEARLAAQLHNEHIVDVLDAGIDEESDTPFIVMELLEGEDLASRVGRKRRFSPSETVVYLSQVAVALDRTHKASIIHRDLKPGNLFLTEWSDGEPLVKVLDFGIAKFVAEQSVQGPTQSAGTPLYMAPEQFRQAPVTAAVDIYALGMIAFRFLVGHHYFAEERDRADNAYALLMTLSQGPPEPASVRAARLGTPVPHGFDAWFARATHIDPAQRFDRAGNAVLALATALGVKSREPLPQLRKPRMTGALSRGVDSTAPAPPEPQKLAPTVQRDPPKRAHVTEAGAPPTLPYSARSPANAKTALSPTSQPPSQAGAAPTLPYSARPANAKTALLATVSDDDQISEPTLDPSVLMTMPATEPFDLVPRTTSNPPGTLDGAAIASVRTRAFPWLWFAAGTVLLAGIAIAITVALSMPRARGTVAEARLTIAQESIARAQPAAPAGALAAAPTPEPAAAPSGGTKANPPATATKTEPAPAPTTKAKTAPAAAAPPAAAAKPAAKAEDTPEDLYSRE